MKIAVVQHTLRPAPAHDVEALVASASRAESAGAELVIVPRVAAVCDGPLADELLRRLESDVGIGVFVCGADMDLTHAGVTRVVALVGDECMDSVSLQERAASEPDILVLAPGSESELQAEAMLELAIGLSTAVAPLVIVAEPDGAEPGEPGHGGSVIVHLGEVLAEALAGDGLLMADVMTPIGRLGLEGQLPPIPPLLAGRIAAHHGRRPPVDYPADIS